MDILAFILGIVELGMREVALFAAVGFSFLGLSDLAVDLAWTAIAVRRRLILGRLPGNCAQSLAAPLAPGPIAVFVPAWDEATVIGDMLRDTRAAFGEADYRIYVGCYPNDPATVAAVRALADCRIRLVIGPTPGPTSKADCLNRLWEQMHADESAEARRIKMVLLHDAEDIVHSAELRVFDTLIEWFDLVQLPVVPLIDPNSRWVSGHYIGPVEVGGGLWGAAQPGAARLDAGPQLAVPLCAGRSSLRLAAEYRFRLAGDAEPGPGPVLTLGAGF